MVGKEKIVEQMNLVTIQALGWWLNGQHQPVVDRIGSVASRCQPKPYDRCPSCRRTGDAGRADGLAAHHAPLRHIPSAHAGARPWANGVQCSSAWTSWSTRIGLLT